MASPITSDLKAENEALKDQVENQKGAEIEAQTAITKYYELLKLYRLTSVHSYKSVIAQVVGEAPSNFQNTVEITVGTARASPSACRSPTVPD